MVFILLSVVLIVIFYFLYRYWSSVDSLPEVHHGCPLVGPLIAYQHDPAKFLLESRKKYGDTFTVNLIFKKFHFINCKEDVLAFYQAPNNVLDIYGIGELFTGVFGLIPAGDSPHKIALEKLVMEYISHHFGANTTYQNLKILENTLGLAIKKWGGKEQINIFEECSELVLTMMLQNLFSYRLSSEIIIEYIQRYRELESSTFSLICLLCHRLPFAINRKNRAHRQWFQDFFYQQLEKENNSLFQYLQLYPESKKYLSFFIICVTLIVNTNMTQIMAWTLVQLAYHQKKQQQLRDEQRLLLSEPLNMQVFRKMKCMDCCFQETIRLYSQLMLVRKTNNNYQTNKYQIKKDELVCISPYLMHHDENIYPNPFEWVPERFHYPKNENTINFLPFGYGIHSCKGNIYALVVCKLCCGLLLRHYEIQLVNDEIPSPNYTKAIGTPLPLKPAFIRLKQL